MSETGQGMVRGPRHRWDRPWVRHLGGSCVVGAIAGAIIAVAYQVWHRQLSAPLHRFSGDSQQMAAIIRNIHDTGWYLSNPHLGAPFGQHLYDFPNAGESLQIVALRILTLFTPRPYLVMNVYFLLGFPALAIVSYLVLRHLRFRFLVAAPVALFYTYLPYHFAHGEAHLFRSTYLSGPLAALLLLWLLAWRDRFLVDPDGPVWGPRRLRANLIWPRVAAAVAVCLFLASFETMAIAFTLTAVAGTTIVTAIRHREPSRLAPGAAAVVLIGLTFALLLLPNLLYWHAHGTNHDAASRIPAEQEMYGLKISAMLLPLPGHHVDQLGQFTQKASKYSPVPSEAGQELGVLGAIGFLVMLYGAVAHGLRRFPSGADPYERRRLLGNGGLASLILVLFATISGLALILSTIGFSQIRTWNRALVIIAFFAFIAVATGLEWVLGRLEKRLRPRSVLAAALAATLLSVAVGAFGLWDTDTVANTASKNHLYAAQASELKAFDTRLAHVLPKGAMIFQLPAYPFPEEPPLRRMMDYDEFLPFLFTTRFRFSYGAIKGRPAGDWQRSINSADPGPRTLAGLRGLGFDGILLDTYAYPDDGAGITAKLTAELGPPVVISVSRRWRFWDLRTYAERAGLSEHQLHTAAERLVGPELMADLDR